MREEMVIQTDCCFMKTRPQDEIITTLVGVDDKFGRCVAICVERKGARDVLGVKALAAFVRSLVQPRLVTHSDGEHSIVELVRQTCDELPRARQQVTPTASKGSNGRVEQANRAVEGMTSTIMQRLETRYNVEIPTGHPVVQWAIRHAAWQWERFRPGEDDLNGYYRQYQRNYLSAMLPFAQIVLWREPGPHMLLSPSPRPRAPRPTSTQRHSACAYIAASPSRTQPLTIRQELLLQHRSLHVLKSSTCQLRNPSKF